MKTNKFLPIALSFLTLFSATLFTNNNVKAETAVKTTVLSESTLPQQKTVVDSNGNLRPVKLSVSKSKAIPGVYSTQTAISTNSTFATAAYVEPYSIIYTPLGSAMFLQQGCTDRDYRANGWVSALQSDLNSLSNTYGFGISITVDGEYGPATASAIRTFQSKMKYTWGCTTMSIDGVAGNQTWTAIYALFDGYNPHSYIP